MVILVDNQDRENEGDLVFPAQFITPEIVNFMSFYARGLICVALDEEATQRMNLPQMVSQNDNLAPQKTAFTVSVEAARGITTGISATDRAQTIQVLAKASSQSQDLVRPGHIFPIRAQAEGVFQRAGHTEASVDLCRLGKLRPVAVICEIMNPDGTMARRDDLVLFSQKHLLKIGTIEDLIYHRKKVAL